MQLLPHGLKSLHDLLSTSDNRLQLIASKTPSLTLDHFELMKAKRTQYSEFLGQVAAIQVKKMKTSPDSNTLNKFSQLHGIAFSKIHLGSNMSFEQRQDLAIMHDISIPIEVIINKACKKCGIQSKGDTFDNAVQIFREHGIHTSFDFHSLDRETLMDRLSEMKNWRLCDALVRKLLERKKHTDMTKRTWHETFRHDVFLSVRLLSITDLKTAEMSFRSDFLLITAWNDPIGMITLSFSSSFFTLPFSLFVSRETQNISYEQVLEL
jgi:hypothetical protein